MLRYVGQYISTYNLCLYTKPTRHSPVDELYPLLVSRTYWDMLSVNFIVELPKSSSCDTVMIVIDLVSKKAHFIPTHMIVTVEGVA